MQPLRVALGQYRRHPTFWLTYNQMMASYDRSRLISQLVAMLRGNPQCDVIRPCPANTPNATVFAREREIVADLSDKDEYLAFFPGALEYSSFPHVRPPRYAQLIGNHTRTDAWIWHHNHIKEDLR